MSGECEKFGEHPIDCICYSDIKYQDATIHIKQMFLDFLKYMEDHDCEFRNKDELIDGFIKDFIIKEKI